MARAKKRGKKKEAARAAAAAAAADRTNFLSAVELPLCGAALTLTPSWTRRGRDIRDKVALPTPAEEARLLYYAEVGPTLEYLGTINAELNAKPTSSEYKEAMEAAHAKTQRAPRGYEYEAREADAETKQLTWKKHPLGEQFSVFGANTLRRYVALDASYVDHKRCRVRKI